MIRFAAKTRAIFLSLLGISWFWLVGALILAQLPAYARDVLGGDKTVYTLLLAAFSIGTALGSLACERLSGHKVEIGLVPLGSIGMTVCLLDLYFEHPDVHAAGAAVVVVDSSSCRAGGWDIALDCALIGVFGGLFIVPLYALILQRSAESHRARIIACNNILNAGFMVIAALLAIGWLEVLHFTIPQLFILAGGAQRRRGDVHLHAGARVPDALPVVGARERHVPHQGARAREHSGDRPRAHRLQSRELHGCAGHRRQRAAAGALRHGSQHLQDPGAELHLPHRARDSDRAGARRSRRAAEGLRPDRRRARRRRDRLHLSRGQAHDAMAR